MNLLFVIHSPRNEKTAVYKGYLNKKIAFEKKGWDVDILTPEEFAFSSHSGRFLPLVYPFQVARWLQKTKVPFDLVVFHSYCGWVFLFFKRWLTWKKKFFKTAITFHGVEELFFQAMKQEGIYSEKPLTWRFRFFYCFLLVWAIKLSCRKSDHVFCLNSQEKSFLQSSGYQAPEKISIRPNDIQPEFFTPRTYRENATNLLFVGQWLPMKGIKYLVQAFELLANHHQDLRLTLAGTLKTEAAVLQDFPNTLHARIKVIPEIIHEDIIAYYKNADIFILPSLFEAFNRALVEAMATGLPVITTSVGIVEDHLREGIDCLKIEFRNPRAIAKAVEALLSNSTLRESLGRSAQLSVQPFEQSQALDVCFQGYYDLMSRL